MIQNVLAESQDKVLKRVEELKEKIKLDEIVKKKLESQLKEQLVEKDNIISKLKAQVSRTFRTYCSQPLLSLIPITCKIIYSLFDRLNQRCPEKGKLKNLKNIIKP